MLKTLALLVVVFLVQETVSTSTVVAVARQQNISWWLINIIFFLTTVLDLFFPYLLGRYIAGHHLIKNRIEPMIKRSEKLLGRYGMMGGVILLGFINFTFINGFLSAFISVDVKKAFIVFFLGNLLWYLEAIAINIGFLHLFHSGLSLFIAVVGSSLTLSMLSIILFNRFKTVR